MSKEVLKFDPENWDWYAFLDASESIKQEYEEDANELAGSWTTCACGQVCNVLPRDEYRRPKDYKLAHLGRDFYKEIETSE